MSTPLKMPSPSMSCAEKTTVKKKVVVLVKPPPVAEIATTVVEDGAVGDAVRVTVAVHVGIQLGGENAEAVTPAGRAVAKLKVTVGLVPATNVAITASTPPAPPLAIVNVTGVAARLKSQRHP